MEGLVKINDESGFNTKISGTNFKWLIRDGRKTLFWEDTWFNEEKLCITFERLYNISLGKFQTVREFCELWNHPETEPHMLWSRDLRAWELEESVKLNDYIAELNFAIGNDILIWKQTGKCYSAADGRQSLGLTLNSNGGVWKHLWKLKILPKVQFFLWKIENKILPTKDLLRKRLGENFQETTCIFCQREVESQDHLLWSCNFVKKIWASVFDWWGLTSEFPSQQNCSYWAWLNWFKIGGVKSSWGVAIAATLWFLDKIEII